MAEFHGFVFADGHSVYYDRIWHLPDYYYLFNDGDGSGICLQFNTNGSKRAELMDEFYCFDEPSQK